MVNTLDSLAHIHHRLGNRAAATRSSRQHLELLIRIGHRYDIASTLIKVGDAHDAAGKPHAAHQAWRQAAAMLADSRDDGRQGP